MSNEQLFNPDENEQRKQAMFSLIKSKQSVLFAGSGLSCRLGYPDWKTLLGKLALEVGMDDPPSDPRSFPIFADGIKKLFIDSGKEGRYNEILNNEFGRQILRNKDLSIHKTLVKLPFKNIVTSNYDFSLEEAIIHNNNKDSASNLDNNHLHLIPDASYFCRSLTVDHKDCASEFLLSLSIGNNEKVTHIHGDCNSPRYIVLTDKDYQNAYFPEVKKDMQFYWSLHRKILWALLSTQRIVFLGFSIDDPYLAKMFDMVCTDLSRWNRPVHFAVMSITEHNKKMRMEKRMMLLRDFGIDVVFYEKELSGFDKFDKLIYELQEHCNQ